MNIVATLSHASGYARAALLAMTTITLAACNSGPPPRLYLLEAPALGGASDTQQIASLRTLGTSTVRLPGYAGDARVATVRTDGVVVQMDSQRWAEEPEDAITRLLAERLRQRASAAVLIEPWPRDFEPRARVEVSFDRLLRQVDGGAHLTGQIQLLSGDGRRLLQLVPFDLLVRGRSTDVAEYFNAVATGVDDIARKAIESLVAMQAGA